MHIHISASEMLAWPLDLLDHTLQLVYLIKIALNSIATFNNLSFLLFEFEFDFIHQRTNKLIIERLNILLVAGHIDQIH